MNACLLRILPWVMGAMLVATIEGCGAESSESRQPDTSEKGPGQSTDTNLGDDSGSTTGAPESSSAAPVLCAAPTGKYEVERTTVTDAQGGPPSSCAVGTYSGEVMDFTQAPGKDFPGCTKTREDVSSDGCIHTTETACSDALLEQSCLTTLEFSPDLSTFTGTVKCSGVQDGVDERAPFTCTSTLEGKRL